MDYAQIARALIADVPQAHVRPLYEGGLVALIMGPYTDRDTHEVFVPSVTDDETLAILSHELGHVVTTPAHGPRSKKEKVWQEFMASRWGANAIRRHLGYVPEGVLEAMRGALNTYLRGTGATPAPQISAFMQGGAL